MVFNDVHVRAWTFWRGSNPFFPTTKSLDFIVFLEIFIVYSILTVTVVKLTANVFYRDITLRE